MFESGLSAYDPTQTDPTHPSHRSGTKEAAWAFVFFCIAGVVLFSSIEVTWMSVGAKALLTISVGLVCAFVMKKWISGAALRHRAKLENEYRSSQNTPEVLKAKIEEARASGDFDRWEKP